MTVVENFITMFYVKCMKILALKLAQPHGKAPYSNGMVERNNKVLYESMIKTKEDTNCNFEMALAWSVSAKNALRNIHGYRTNQLVFG